VIQASREVGSHIRNARLPPPALHSPTALRAQEYPSDGQKSHPACALRTKRPELRTQIPELTKVGVS